MEAVNVNVENRKEDGKQSDPIPRNEGRKRLATVADLQQVLPSIEWLWKPWLPKGFVTLLAGEPGIGKSGFALALLKPLIANGLWPDATFGLKEPSTVLWVDTEASQAILAERVMTLGLPADRILLPGSDPLSSISLLGVGSSELEKMIRENSPSLLIIDSLIGAHSLDENSTQDMRGVLGQLAHLAQNTKTAILVIHHLRKAGFQESEKINLDRIRGSSTIVSFARVVLGIERVGSNLQVRCIKNNLSILPESIGVIQGGKGIEFTKPPEESAPQSKAGIALTFLHEILTSDPQPFEEIVKKAASRNISKNMLYAARKTIWAGTPPLGWYRPKDIGPTNASN